MRTGADLMLVWTQAVRHGKTTGVKANPFAEMGTESSSGAARGSGAATCAGYNVYHAVAHAMGKASITAAATICFEGCQCICDAFGFEDPDGRISRGVRWGGYSRQLSPIPSQKLLVGNRPTAGRCGFRIVMSASPDVRPEPPVRYQLS